MTNSEAAAPVRKRGRPPKEGGPVPPKPVVLGPDGQPRKRGRPPADGGVAKSKTKPVVLDASGQPRKRGRPPKTDGQAAPKPKTAVQSTSDQPGKRGRPRKTPVGEAAVKADAQGTPTRGRGRPRKNPVDAGDETPAKTAAKANGTPKDTPGRGRGRPAANPLKKFLGTYAIECPTITEEWPKEAEDMEISISTSDLDPNGLIASFDLGIVEGTMLLATTEEALDAFQDKVEKGEDSSEEESNEDDESDEPPPKKIKSTLDNGAMKLYFKWRGRETSEGQIHNGDGNSGTIEFLDDKAIQFKGVGSFPAMGAECKFTGTRFDNDAAEAPVPWSEFSDAKAEEANKNRWR
ncbi:uncharacterized protein GIQ15_06666 [Arthroderma uncinatum]|uniref:uncharacterized protein n=1 Tax=Arthroderma uncinatum TaxID=74035 RepID=UPI00144AF077|nr:uncharacterized protein GIQ15_06666 [Arthroderma uncinatum]KAF3479690.1 hypothetical protein GIQ15_06666 [Arthroderma uncinatum]